MNFPVVIHKDKRSDYGVTVPDLPGCFSAGRTIDEALAMTKEAIELHLEGLTESGQPIPQPGTIERHRANRDYRGGTWAVVSIDEESLRVKVVRLNITMPERVVDAVDRYAAQHGETRSGLLVRAVTAYMGRPDDRALKPASRGRRKTKAKER
ncbi:MAG: type II toxin-antitoxin system HicB family antitoxin [Pirellulales bacterium]